MKYETAVNMILLESHYHGLEYDYIMELCAEEPEEMPPIIVEAYEVIREEEDPDPGAFSDREAFRVA